MSHSVKHRSVQAIVAISLVLLFSISLRPQQSKGGGVLRLTTRIVNINVVVTDAQGNPVKGLTQDDFIVLDEGQQQRISFFVAADNEQPNAVVTPQAPGFYSNSPAMNGPDPGVTVLLFDTLNSHWTSQGYGLNNVRNFIRQLSPSDRIGIYVLGNDLTVVHDFFHDASDLVAAIQRYDETRSSGPKKTAASEQKSEEGPIDHFLEGKDNHYNFWMENVLRSGVYAQEHAAFAMETTTAWLEAIARQLSGVSGRKSLIWVTDGLGPMRCFDSNDLYESLSGPRTGGDVRFACFPFAGNGDDVERMIRLMDESGIAVYMIDARGLETIDLGFRPKASDIMRQPNPVPISATGPVDELLPRIPQPVPGLLELSQRTGGRAFYNRNDLETGIRRALNDSRFTYELGYYPDHNRWKGEWRKIQVKVNRPDVRVLARAGYFALPDPRPQQPKDRIELLSQIAASPLDATQFPLSVQITSCAEARGRELTAMVHLKPQLMLSVGSDGHWKGNFEIMFMQLDLKNKLLDATQKDAYADLNPNEYAEVVQKGWDLPTQLKIMPGATVLCVILHEKNSDAVGSVHIPLVPFVPSPCI